MPTLDAIYRASCGESVSSTSAYSGTETSIIERTFSTFHRRRHSPPTSSPPSPPTIFPGFTRPATTGTPRRRTPLDSRARQLHPHHPRHAQLLHSEQPPAVGLLPARTALRGARTKPTATAAFFGAHIANLLRRLRRVCALYRTVPVFYGASATSSNPVESFSKLIGVPQRAITAITESTAARGETTVALWEPNSCRPRRTINSPRVPAAPSSRRSSRRQSRRRRAVSPRGAGCANAHRPGAFPNPLPGFAGSRRSVEIPRRRPNATSTRSSPVSLTASPHTGPDTPRRAPRARTQAPQRRAAGLGQHLRAGAGH